MYIVLKGGDLTLTDLLYNDVIQTSCKFQLPTFKGLSFTYLIY